jgi:hypothetical protein
LRPTQTKVNKILFQNQLGGHGGKGERGEGETCMPVVPASGGRDRRLLVRVNQNLSEKHAKSKKSGSVL